jgi:hypothetical protein
MRYLRGFIISIGVHILLALVLWLAPKQQFVPHQKVSIVELLEKPELPARPHQLDKKASQDEKEFVRKADIPKEILTKDEKKKRFASADEQNVLEEQRAREVALTKNRSAAAEAKKMAQSHTPKSARQGKLNFSPTSPLDRAKREILEDETGGGVRVAAVDKTQPQKNDNNGEDDSRYLPMPNFGGFDRGASTVGETLPQDIKFGDFTALNTDKNLFYSFYARMEEMTRYRWETYAKAAVNEIGVTSKTLMAKDMWTTKLEIILDRYGTFQHAILQDSSGITTLDSAPVQAFRDAGRFPNPPSEMVKADGFIHIFYAFSVNVVPRYAAQ